MHSCLKKKTNLFSNITSPLLGMCTFLSLNPYFLWNNKFFYWLLLLVLGLLVVIILSVRMKIEKESLILLMFSTYVFVCHQSLALQKMPIIASPLAIALIFMLADRGIKIRASFVFRDLYVLSLVPSIIYFFLILIGVNLGWSMLESLHPFKSEAGHFYRHYFGMVVLSNQIFPSGIGEIFRLSGMFDEPGVVGTISGMFLAANSFKVNDWRGKLLLLSGVLSFSLAFYLIGIIYVGLKRPFSLLIVFFFSVVLIQYIIPDDIKENQILKRYVIERAVNIIYDFESVDNRVSESFENYYTEFLESDSVMNGMGNNAHKFLNCNVSSYKQLIYNRGMVGFSLMFLFYVVFTVFVIDRKHYKFALPFIIVSLAVVYQRPDISRAWFVIVYFYGLIEAKKSWQVEGFEKLQS